MRVASLLPSATDMAVDLGLAGQLVAVSHSCDHPAAAGLPVMTRSSIGAHLPPADIDAAVSAAVREGRPLYQVLAEVLDAVRPDLLLTQGVCEVCAVTPGTIQDALRALPDSLPTDARTLSLDGKTLSGILGDVQRVADAAGVPERGEALTRAARDRWAAITPAAHAPRVLTLEWTDPPFYGGHWVPEQVERAGGVNVLGRAGQDSGRATWADISALNPDVIVVMCCGYGLADNVRFAQDLRAHAPARTLRAVQAGQLWATDANALYSRPSLGVVRGAEVLAALLRGEPTHGASVRLS
ncbi:ABC transporter substrate-binding protein [Deinococcus maricopensis]|uniref:Fe/B12 periplasmic-binding domain-containing protein n=1 Tax=Deinococcus maricopensis (strain DSM 21211 / LMG 22137 / NRRL B-23946 / LB-34) TaxID=709986 RepID=E8UA30_DEIML|nr:ABC transporter substrate-binding protein [Deinococcus maricopensis]ADV67919.1 hypothetical protein Deima_2281 [Deinococcus maricopensis DSM 21211]